MRAPLLAVLLLAFLPFATALPPPTTFTGVDPFGGSYSYDQQYDPPQTVECAGATTLQVVQNTLGGWDLLVRRGAAAPTPFSEPGSLAGSAAQCPFSSGAATTWLNVPGSPSEGFYLGYADACSGWSVHVPPFTWSGPAYYWFDYHYAGWACDYGAGYFVQWEYASFAAMV